MTFLSWKNWLMSVFRCHVARSSPPPAPLRRYNVGAARCRPRDE